MRRIVLSFFASLALADGALAQTNGFYVEACNLGCSNGAGGAVVWCALVDTYVNIELALTFSLDVDPSSVNAATFQIFDVMTGTSPTGDFVVTAASPRTIRFRPSLSFDTQGDPVFGFEPDRTYQIFIPGTGSADSPPFVRSASGRANGSRVMCTIRTTLGVQVPIYDFCSTSPNSVGAGAILSASGSNLLSQNNLVLDVTGAPAQSAGLFFLGTSEQSVPLGAGVRCAGGTALRFSPTTTDMTGKAAQSLDVGLAPLAGLATPGSTLLFQFWYRDLATTGSNLSNGIAVTYWP